MSHREPNPAYLKRNESVDYPLVLRGHLILEEGSTLQSPNYEAGISGWIFRGDGTYELN